MGSSQFSFCPNFSSLTVPQAELSNALISVSAALCFLIDVFILLVLILYKAYGTALQRAFFHYVLTTSLSLASTTVMVELQFNVTREFCKWLAFFKEWWYLSSHLFSVGVVVAIIISAYNIFKSVPPNSCARGYKIPALEAFLSILAFFFPLTYLWRPMRDHHFGLVGSTCWIEVYNETCALVGDGEVAFSSVIVLLQVAVSLLYSVLLIVLHLFIIKKYKQNCKSRLKFLCRALFLLVVCDVSTVRVAIDHVMSIQRISYGLNQAVYITMDNCLENVLAVLLAVAFGFYIYSPSKLRWAAMKQATAEFLSCTDSQHKCCFKPHYGSSSCKGDRRNNNNKDDSNTFEDSSEDFVPSYTTYTAPYTNEFTEVTEILTKGKTVSLKYGST